MIALRNSIISGYPSHSARQPYTCAWPNTQSSAHHHHHTRMQPVSSKHKLSTNRKAHRMPTIQATTCPLLMRLDNATIARLPKSTAASYQNLVWHGRSAVESSAKHACQNGGQACRPTSRMTEPSSFSWKSLLFCLLRRIFSIMRYNADHQNAHNVG